MDLLDAFELGDDVRYVRFQAILGGYIRRKEGMYILDTLKEMHTLLKEAEIAENIVKRLSDWITKLEKSYPKADTTISKKDANALEKDVDSWKKEIRRELERKPVIAIELQSGLNPNELTKVAEQKPSEFIPSEI